jgi:hypothetical protein
MPPINWIAVLVAGLSAFVIGGVWYSPALFGNAWMKENDLTPEKLKKGNKGKIFGFTAIFSLVMSANLAMLISDPTIDLKMCIFYGFLTGIWMFCAIAIHSLFELRSWKTIFINGGYSLVSMSLMGAIIGVWK